MPYISKTKYLNGLQCHKLLWYQYNAKDVIPPVDAATQAKFDQGHEVGQYAKQLFPDGIEIEGDPRQFGMLLANTKRALDQRRPIFEATFVYNDLFARVDILEPASDNTWNIVEVKSSTDLKDVNLHDLALQKYILELSGLTINKCFLMHIDNSYVRKGEIEPEKLLTRKDVSEKVDSLLPDVQVNAAAMFDTIRSKACPEITIGPHCKAPYECPLIPHCHAFLPEQNVLTISRIGGRGYELVEQGVYDISALPESTRLSQTQRIQVGAVKSGKTHLDANAIAGFLSTLEYPLHFLDFESFSTAIPLYDNVRPYQQVPFQFSLIVVPEPGAAPKEYTYLANGDVDPRPEFMAELKRLIGPNGSIIVYNAVFEKGILAKAVDTFPVYAEWVDSLEDRFVDLLEPFRSFHFYHPQQLGRSSLKSVLPVVTGLSYDGMPIADGGAAGREYVRVTFGDVAEEDKAAVRRQLLDYCGLDTRGMVEILERLTAPACDPTRSAGPSAFV